MIQNKFYQDIFMNMPCKCPLKIYLINLKITQPRIQNKNRFFSKNSFREHIFLLSVNFMNYITIKLSFLQDGPSYRALKYVDAIQSLYEGEIVI